MCKMSNQWLFYNTVIWLIGIGSYNNVLQKNQVTCIHVNCKNNDLAILALTIHFSFSIFSSPLEYTITLAREGNESLGFSIVGGINSPKGDSPIYIKGIASKSIAAIDGRIKVK